ncbi:MAG: hypothetical protein JSW63_02780 [Ignavibacterium sp.]|nr:MAG: hypothetical protein JSW63_02780 [Ignavibacterium sp.]
MNDLTNLTAVKTMQIDLDVFINSAIVAYKQKIKRGGQIEFTTGNDNDIFQIIIPNHDKLFNDKRNCITKKISKGKTLTVTINNDYHIPKGQVVLRYYHVWQQLDDKHPIGINEHKGKYVDLEFSSPPKIVVT